MAWFYQVIKDMTAGGVDYSFECVGSAQVVESALLSCHDVNAACFFHCFLKVELHVTF